MTEQKDFNSTKIDNENKESSTKSKVIKGICYVSLVIVGYAILGLVIFAFQSPTKNAADSVHLIVNCFF